jgi:hypothetical protein
MQHIQRSLWAQNWFTDHREKYLAAKCEPAGAVSRAESGQGRDLMRNKK